MFSNLTVNPTEQLSLPSFYNEEEIKKKNNVLCNAEKFANLSEDHYNLHSLDYAFLKKDSSLLKDFFPFNNFSFNFSNSSNAHKSFHQITQTFQEATHEISEKNLIYRCILEGKTNIISSFFNRNRYTFDLYPIHGLTCMHFAAMGNSPEIIQLLKDHHVKIDAMDEWGRTPLHYAAINPNKELFPSLVGDTKDLFQKDFLGVSPLDLLYCQALIKDPIKTTSYELFQTSLLFISAFLEIASLLIDTLPVQNIKPFIPYITQISQISYLLKNNLEYLPYALLSIAFYLLSQQFTLLRLGVSIYLVGATAHQAFNQLRAISHFYYIRPSDALKKLSCNLIQFSSFGVQLLTHFPPSFFQENFNNLQSTPLSKLHFSKIGKQSFVEWEKFSKFTQACFNNLEQMLGTYFG